MYFSSLFECLLTKISSWISSDISGSGFLMSFLIEPACYCNGTKADIILTPRNVFDFRVSGAAPPPPAVSPNRFDDVYTKGIRAVSKV